MDIKEIPKEFIAQPTAQQQAKPVVPSQSISKNSRSTELRISQDTVKISQDGQDLYAKTNSRAADLSLQVFTNRIEE